MSQSLFRKVSLERLSSPEQLDELIKITSPKAWLALIGVSCIIISAVVWGFFGSIPTKVEGHGILINNGGVFSLQHHTSGQVIDVSVKPGGMVKKGDVVARIEVPHLVSEINSQLNTLWQLEINNQIGTSEYLAIISQIKSLREELVYRSQIVSQIDGRILELNIRNGSLIEPGDSLITLEQYGGTVKLEAVIYVPVELGGIIMPGIEVHISPTIVNKEEYGYMLGRVIAISDYPATTASMLQTLGNENLVSLLAGQGAPLMVRVDLIPDDHTESGYRWSSPAGPPLAIHSGTIVQSAVITNREKPISKVIPLVKNVVR